MATATDRISLAGDRDALVLQYMPLVRHVIARLPVSFPATLGRDDFYSVGLMGLMHAADSYDPERGASFKTFAYTAIRGAVLDEIRKHDPVPRNRRDRLRQVDRVRSALHAELNRPPTLEEIADGLGVSAEVLDDDLLALHTWRILSLDEPIGAGEDTSALSTTLRHGATETPDTMAEQRELRARVADAIRDLPETERHVVALYHFEGLFLKEIGAILSVTESRVSQILSRALERLRVALRADR